jgi:Spy/CpxP family protein refolding chaperone
MTKLVVIIGFAVAFAAGLIVGLESRQTSIGSTAAPAATRPSGGRGPGPGWLTSELNLNPQQQEQMKQIWSEVARHGRGEQEDRRRQLRSERDDAIAALVPAQDKEKYEQIRKNYSDQMAAMDQDMRSRFDEAVKKTKDILTPEQRTKYDEILSRHQGDRGGPRGGPGGPGGPERHRDPTTRRGDFGGGATPRSSSQP